MSEQSSGSAQDVSRCPSCGARVGASQPWCTLCHRRLDAGDAVTSSPPEVTAAGGDPDPGPTTPLPPGAVEAMLAELAASTASTRPLARGPLAGRGRVARIVLTSGAVLVLTAVGVGLLTLVGLLL